jgi:hypothetical protein
MSSDTPDYQDAFNAGYLAALEVSSEQEEQYTPTPEYEGAPTVTYNGVTYSGDAMLQAQATAQQAQAAYALAAQIEAQRREQQMAVSNEAAEEVLAAMVEKYGSGFQRDQKDLYAFLSRNPGLVVDGDAQTMAEQMDTAYRLMKMTSAEDAKAAKQIDDDAFAESLVQNHQRSYASHMADKGK